jgi:hypothetical protein
MAYIGQQPVVGRYILLDQISGGFNGTTSGFTMSTAGGVQGVKPGLAQNVLLSLGGVIQQPGVDYTISGSGITFTTPPVSGTTFFATVLGDAQSVGTPSDGTVTPASIAAGYDFAFPNVNVTGVTTIASGSASTPSLSVTGDSNTGLLSPAANTIAVSTDGTERLRVDSSGQVGIGTASPGANLHISSTGDTIARVTSADGNGAFLDLGDASDPDGGRIVYDSGSNLTFSTASTERLRVDSSGRLGIGTTSPAHAVHIAGATTPELIVEDTTNNVKAVVGADNTVGRIGTDTNHDLTLRTNDTERMRINGTGTLQIGGTANLGSQRLQVHGNSNSTSDVIIANSVANTGQTATLTFAPANNITGTRIVAVSEEDFSVSANRTARMEFYTRKDGTLSERMRIDSSGNIGIGETSPNKNLVVKKANGGGDVGIRIQNDSTNNSGTSASLRFTTSTNDTFDTGSIVVDRGTGAMIFSEGEVEAMRIDNQGRLLVGNSSAETSFRTPKVQIKGSDNNTGLLIHNTNSSADGASIIFAHSRGTGTVNSGDLLGDLVWCANDGTDIQTRAAYIRVAVDGAPGSNDMPGRMQFYTTADGSSSPTERMRIDSSGNIGIGTTSNLLSNSTRRTLSLNHTGSAAVAFGVNGTREGHIYVDNDEMEISATDNYIYFTAGSSERMRIDTSGNVGIGLTPAYSGPFGGSQRVLHVGGSAAPGVRIQSSTSNQGDYIIQASNSGGRTVFSNLSSNADTTFHHAPSGSSTETIRFQNAGGISFNGDTAAANALDDYEEGESNTSVNGVTASTNTVAMKYTKVGNLVTIVGVITLAGITSHDGINGNFNLPFTPSAYATSVPGCDIQRNDIDTGTKYLGTYGANPNLYFNAENGGYRGTSNLTAGKIGFTISYTTW